MATATHLPAKLLLAQAQLSSSLGVNFDDTTAGHFVCGIVVAGNGIPLTQNYDLTGVTGTWSSGVNTIPVSSGAGLLPNMAIAGGSGLPSPCYIVSVAGTTVTISANTTAAQSTSASLAITGGVQFISDITATNTEMSYSGYARQSLSGITCAIDSNGTQVDWGFSNITFPQEAADPGTGRYAFIAYKGPSGSYADSAAPVVGLLDLGQTVSTVNGTLTLSPPAGGLINFTGAG